MSRLAGCFAALKGKRPALVAYLTAGDPSLDETPDLIAAVAEAGADVVELGVPFSDPFADGPVIQKAMERALGAGGAGQHTVPRVLDALAAARKRTQVPIVLFGYYNPLLQQGLDKVCAGAQQAGADGLLVVDLPPPEAGELDAPARAHQLDRIGLVAPTTTPERAAVVAATSSGFLYYVALAGVTGAGHLDPTAVATRVAALRNVAGALPIVAGFGIRDEASARAVGRVADGVVVGSALIESVAAARDRAGRLAAATGLISRLRAALET